MGKDDVGCNADFPPPVSRPWFGKRFCLGIGRVTSGIMAFSGRALAWGAAILLVAGLAVSQILLGGWWYPALAGPGYLLVGAAAVLAGASFWRANVAPGAFCVGSALLFALYLLMRQATSPDAYVAREDAWLVLGALAVYLTAAWQIRGEGPRWSVLGTLLLLGAAQSVVAAAQFASASPAHPMAGIVPDMGILQVEPDAPNFMRVTGTLASRGSLSAVLLATTFMSLGALVWGRGRAAVKLLLLWSTAAGFVGLALSLARAAYIGAMIGLVVFALASFFIIRRGAPVHRGLLSAAALSVVGLVLAAALVVASESVAVRLRFESLGLDDFRENLWFVTVPPMLSLEPWFGVGGNMFDQLSARYRDLSFAGRPVHAHNDWLQLLIEYGRVGLALGVACFATHFFAGWRNALRLAREAPPAGWIPQGTSLGLVAGSLAALSALAIHSFFDYRLHVPAVALLAALCAGWIAASRDDSGGWDAPSMPRWLHAVALLPLLPGAALLIWVGGELPAERRALESESEMVRGDPSAAWESAQRGLVSRPNNPRLLVVAGEAAGQLGNLAQGPGERREWYARSAECFGSASRERPYFAYALREEALALDWSGQPVAALPVHLRAIGRDPRHASGYEYLALHYWSLGRLDEAESLMQLSCSLPGIRLVREYLPKIQEAQRQRAAPAP